MFDVNAFVNQTYNQATSSDYALIPEANDVRMMTGSGPLEKWFRTFTANDVQYVTLEVPMIILDEAIKTEMARDTVMSRYKMFLDFDETGNLDFGKGRNVKLGQLREALGQNDPGAPWSPAMLADAGPLLGKIVHTSGKDGTQYAEVGRVTAL